jgi:hypothetical protein
MAAMIGSQSSETVHESALEPVQRSLAVQLYLERLARLMRLDVTDGPDLSAEERRRLRTRAIVGTIEALTALGAGQSASDLLRAARLLGDRPALCPRGAALSWEGSGAWERPRPAPLGSLTAM